MNAVLPYPPPKPIHPLTLPPCTAHPTISLIPYFPIFPKLYLKYPVHFVFFTHSDPTHHPIGKKEKKRTVNFFHLFDGFLVNGTASTLRGTELETIAESSVDGLEVAHAAGTSGLSPLGFLGPVVCSGVRLDMGSCRGLGGASWGELER